MAWINSRRALMWWPAGIATTVALAAAAIDARPERVAARHSDAAVPRASDETEMVDAEAPYLDDNDAAMNRMMNGMSIVATGNVDRDFVAMMQPHHQGAIDMAEAFLRHGTNERLRRLAQEIIVTQRSEIVAMRLAIGKGPVAQATNLPEIVPQRRSPDTQTSQRNSSTPLGQGTPK